MIRVSLGTIMVIVIVSSIVLGGIIYLEGIGDPSVLCGGCYHYNAPGCFVTPCPGREALNLESSTLNSPTNLTLAIRNTGAMGMSLSSYNVKDQAGNQYTSANWNTSMIYVNQVATIGIIINGSGFTFRSGDNYTIAFTSSRNNIFTFTVKA